MYRVTLVKSVGFPPDPAKDPSLGQPTKWCSELAVIITHCPATHSDYQRSGGVAPEPMLRVVLSCPEMVGQPGEVENSLGLVDIFSFSIIEYTTYDFPIQRQLMRAFVWLMVGLVAAWALTPDRSVARWPWDARPAKLQFQAIAQTGNPWVIIQVHEWPALHRWCSSSYLSQHVPVLSEVRTRPAGAFINEEITALSQQAEQLGLTQPLTEKTVQGMRLQKFLNSKSSQTARLYYAAALAGGDFEPLSSDLPGARSAAWIAVFCARVARLLHFSHLICTCAWCSSRGAAAGLQSFALAGESDSQSFVWMSVNGTTAAAHYDTADNLNVQVFAFVHRAFKTVHRFPSASLALCFVPPTPKPAVVTGMLLSHKSGLVRRSVAPNRLQLRRLLCGNPKDSR